MQAVEWFRMYSDMPSDPKVGTLTDSQFRTWVELLCAAGRESLNGNTGLTLDTVDWALRRNVIGDVDVLISRDLLFLGTEKQFIFVAKWDKRQKQSDSSAERVKRYRDRAQAVSGKRSSSEYEKHKNDVFTRDGHKCVYCNSDSNLCIDHMVPIILGGTHDLDNLATACKSCNSGKAGRTPVQAKYTFSNKKTESIHAEYIARNGYTGECNGYSNGLDKKEREDKKKESVARFAPPSLEEVVSYCQERSNGVDAVKWHNHYQANGWMVGKTKMKDWRAAVRKWETPEQTAKPALTEEQRFEAMYGKAIW